MVICRVNPLVGIWCLSYWVSRMEIPRCTAFMMWYERILLLLLLMSMAMRTISRVDSVGWGATWRRSLVQSVTLTRKLWSNGSVQGWSHWRNTFVFLQLIVKTPWSFSIADWSSPQLLAKLLDAAGFFHYNIQEMCNFCHHPFFLNQWSILTLPCCGTFHCCKLPCLILWWLQICLQISLLVNSWEEPNQQLRGAMYNSHPFVACDFLVSFWTALFQTWNIVISYRTICPPAHHSLDSILSRNLWSCNRNSTGAQ